MFRTTVVIILFSLGIYSNNSFSLELDAEDWENLHRGEVIVQAENINKRKRVGAAIIIYQPIDKIWQVMLDCDRIHEFLPSLEKCELLDSAEDGSWEMIRHTVRYSWLTPKTRYVFKAEYEPKKNIHFKRISGDLNELEGDWGMQVMGDFVLVTYSVYIDPGFLVPGFITRSALRDDLPELMRALRQRVAFAKVD